MARSRHPLDVCRMNGHLRGMAGGPGPAEVLFEQGKESVAAQLT